MEIGRNKRSRGLGQWFSVRVLLFACVVSLLGPSALALPMVGDVPGVSPEAIEQTLQAPYYGLESREATQERVTIHSVVRVGDAGVSTGVESIRLAALESDPESKVEALALTWSPTVSGWGFIVWRLELTSDIGLLGDGQRSTVELARVVPAAGHEYETYLSYDGQEGVVSVSVVDLTEGRTVYRGGLESKPYTGPLYARVGAVIDDGLDPQGLISFAEMNVYGVFLPVGADWTTGVIADSGILLPAWRFDLDEDVVVRLTHPTIPAAGEFRLVSEGAEGPRVVAEYTEVGKDARVSLPATHLPLGTSTLRLEYVVDGDVLLADERHVTTGHATFQITSVRVDRNADALVGEIRATSEVPMVGLHTTVRATIHEMVWDEAERDYYQRPYGSFTLLDRAIDVEAEGEPIPFSIPLPESRGLWEITFEVDTRVGIGKETFGSRKLFTTYQPATLEPGEPFRFAVFPDTQYYAQDYHTVFVRQFQWVAERAEEDNIVLALHLGDLTDDNIPAQWARVAEAFSLLDGVMPYMVAQGNHDMTANGGGQAADRLSTRINDYFPVESMPWVKGTFPEGRIENSYATFEFQGERFLIVSLEFGPRDEALAWANDVVSAHPDHTAIMITHSNINSAGNRTESATGYPIAQNKETTVNGAQAVWTKFTRNHANMLMTLSGHIHSDAIPRRISQGRNGNLVYEMLIDYQRDPNGGNGYFVTLEFRPDNTIEVRSYSPYLGQYRTDVDQYGNTNHFIIERGSARIMNQY